MYTSASFSPIQPFVMLINANRNNLISFAIPGDYEHKGSVRQKELWNACKILNIHDENITLIRATNLPDDPTASWKSKLIAKQVLKQVESLDIDAIITFDRDGVSHHVNHSAIYYATASICISGLIPDGEFAMHTIDSFC